MPRRKYLYGVTLMELLIVVLIIGIITAIAFPNYREYVARAKRNEAKAALLQIATNQERWYLQNNTFTQDLIVLGFSTDPFTTASDTYVVRVTSADANNFTATATYSGTDAENDKCPTFHIDGRGVKSSPDGSYSDCWTRTR